MSTRRPDVIEVEGRLIVTDGWMITYLIYQKCKETPRIDDEGYVTFEFAATDKTREHVEDYRFNRAAVKNVQEFREILKAVHRKIEELKPEHLRGRR